MFFKILYNIRIKGASDRGSKFLIKILSSVHNKDMSNVRNILRNRLDYKKYLIQISTVT